jgi:DNA polymerase-3 subunit chi
VSQVDFHILRESSAGARLTLACRLAERAYRDGVRVLVRVDSESDLAEFDTLLWTFGDGTFVPHDRLTADAAPGPHDAPVALTCGPLPATLAAWPMLIDLALAQPPVARLPERVIEIVDADETRRRLGRERFRAYRDAGVTPNAINHDHETSAPNG